jgi:hypothetical protein
MIVRERAKLWMVRRGSKAGPARKAAVQLERRRRNNAATRIGVAPTEERIADSERGAPARTRMWIETKL